MKRISKIVLENYRAYCDRKEIILPNGENLLIYGENGSGKSSLYKGLYGFLKSFVYPTPFVKNKYVDGAGKIEISFKSFEADNVTINNDGEECYGFYDGNDNILVANVAFLKAAAMTKGFMDYKDLLRVYLHEKSKNIFELIVTNVLRNHSIGTTTIGKEWNNINKDFYTDRRNNILHRRAPERLERFKDGLVVIFKRLEPKINSYLSSYFEEFKISISFNLKKLELDDSGKRKNWKINSELFLKVKYRGEDLENYEDYLNEARLSAISLCIFLAALKDNENTYYKFLFLDDVFIGLDAANRIPILKILKDDFSDYQIIISTYDRYWFNLAKHFFNVNMHKRWKSIELYVGEKQLEGHQNSIQYPIIVDSETNMDKAARYLRNEVHPDYPAAANYLRKALEEKLGNFFPMQEFSDVDCQQFENYELTKRMNSAKKFLKNIHSDYDGLATLDSYMHALLHPMSHFNEEDQIYRSELFDIERILISLENDLKKLAQNTRLICDKGTKCQIRFHNIDNTYTCEYILVLKENLYVCKDNDGNLILSECECQSKGAKENDHGLKQSASYNDFYLSLYDARTKICEYLNQKENRAVTIESGFDGIYYKDVNDFLPIVAKVEEVRQHFVDE